MLLFAQAAIPSPTGNTVIDVITVIGSVLGVVLPLLSGQVRARIAGKAREDAAPNPPAVERPKGAIDQYVAFLQNLVVKLQAQLEELTAENERQVAQMDNYQEREVEMRVRITELEATVDRLRMGWNRP